MNHNIRILHLEDDPKDAELVRAKLEEEGFLCDVVLVDSREDYLKSLEEGCFDLILADYTLPAFDGLSALVMARESCPDTPYVFVSGTIGEERSIEALKKGATDYVIKEKLSLLVPAVRRALKEAEESRERRRAEQALLESQERYRSVVDNINLGISLISPDMRILTINSQFLKWFPAIDASCHPLCYTVFNSPPRDTICSYCPTCRTLKDGQVHEAVTDSPAGDEIRHYRIVSSPVTDAAGTITAAIEMVEDITEQKRSEQRIQRQLRRFAALHDIDMTITSSLDLRVSTNVILGELISQLSVDAADILLLNPSTQTLEYADGRGFRTEALRHTRLRLGEGYAGKSALERRTVHIQNVSAGDNDFVRSPLLVQEGFADYFAIPIITKGHVKGVLEIFHRAPLNPDQEWMDFLEALGTQAAIAIDNASMFKDVGRTNTELILAYEATLECWSRALDLQGRETIGHAKRVTEMAVRLARAMGLRDDELVNIRRGALLHDIGKLGVPDNILQKSSKLTDEEWVTMKKHPSIAYELFWPISFLRQALEIPYCHHEKWDGTGYPRGLKGEQIPLAARIFSVVDVWDDLKSDRQYRPAWSKEKTMEYILKESGTWYDPKVVEVFMGLVKAEHA